MENQDPAPEASMHKVLGVTELLEEILLHLSLGDILYNAQCVNKFWKTCIGIGYHEGGSSRLRKKCFVEATLMSQEEDKQDPLFLAFHDYPEDIALIAPRHMMKYHYFLSKTGNAPFIFSQIRKYFTQNFGTNRNALKDYVDEIDIVVDVANQSNPRLPPARYDIPPALDKFEENSPNKEWDKGHYQLDNSKRHPILDCFDGVSYFWTGYGSHLIFVIGESYKHTFTPMKQIMEALVFLLTTEPAGATWKRGMITQPACTEVTVYVPTRNLAQRKHETFLKFEGVTIEELFQLIAGVCKAALSAVSDQRLHARFHAKYKDVAMEQTQAIVAVEEFEELLADLNLNPLSIF